MADPDRIVQALVNLVANAVKFSPAGTCVRTCVESRDGEALISVADDGRGIPADQLEAVFERFQQVDASDRREKGGTGLGLAISRAIVDQHAGRIWAESEPGQGATFRFTLPLYRAEGTVAVYDRRAARTGGAGPRGAPPRTAGRRLRRRPRRSPRRRERSSPSSPMREARRADPGVPRPALRSSSASCRRLSTRPAAARRRRARHPRDRHDGARARRRLGGDRRRLGRRRRSRRWTRKRPDAVLLDVMMPDVDGPATFERLRPLLGDGVPVIFLTAKPEAERLLRARRGRRDREAVRPARAAARARRDHRPLR